MTDKQLPFQQETDATAKRQVKLDNSRSRFAKKANDEADFQKRAEILMENKNAQSKNGMELVSQFMDAIRDRKIPENRGVVAFEFEKELRSKLVRLAIDFDNDESEPKAGMGSATLNALLLRVVMLQRDRINELDYRISKLEKKSSTPSP